MLIMDAKSKKLCSDALAILIATGSVTLVHKSGRTEPITYENWGVRRSGNVSRSDYQTFAVNFSKFQ